MIHQRDIVLVPFPFSDMTTHKVRPVLVISSDMYNKSGKDMITVPLTTRSGRKHSVKISSKNLESGTLIKESSARADRVFSMHQSMSRMVIGRVKTSVYKNVVFEIKKIIS